MNVRMPLSLVLCAGLLVIPQQPCRAGFCSCMTKTIILAGVGVSVVYLAAYVLQQRDAARATQNRDDMVKRTRFNHKPTTSAQKTNVSSYDSYYTRSTTPPSENILTNWQAAASDLAKDTKHAVNDLRNEGANFLRGVADAVQPPTTMQRFQRGFSDLFSNFKLP